MHISNLAVDYLKSKECGKLVSKPVYDDTSNEFYFSYDGYMIHLFVNLEVKEIDNELCIVISSLENNNVAYKSDKVSEKEFSESLVSDIFCLRDLFGHFPLSLKQLLNDKKECDVP